MKFKKEWTEKELEDVIRAFAMWKKKNLRVTYGNRERTTEGTYGLPYTSSSSFAMLSNTNVIAELINPLSGKKWNFDWLALTENNEVVAGFTDADENEKQFIIGNINIWR